MGDNTDLGLEEAFDFLAGRIETEEENYGEEIPDHAAEMVVADAASLLQTVTSIEMARSMADDDEDAEMDEESFDEALLEDVVDVVASLAALQYETGINIAEGISDRIDFIEDFETFQDAMDEAEGHDEEMQALDEHLTDEIAAEMGLQEQPSAPAIGENVDAADYDHDRVGDSFQ